MKRPRPPMYWLRRITEAGRPCGRRECPRRRAGFSYLCHAHVLEVTAKYDSWPVTADLIRSYRSRRGVSS